MMRYALLPAAALLLAGCSFDGLREFAYDLGEQHACMQRAENTAQEGMNDLNCMSRNAGEKSMSFQEYERAREERLGHAAEPADG